MKTNLVKNTLIFVVLLLSPLSVLSVEQLFHNDSIQKPCEASSMNSLSPKLTIDSSVISTTNRDKVHQINLWRFSNQYLSVYTGGGDSDDLSFIPISGALLETFKLYNVTPIFPHTSFNLTSLSDAYFFDSDISSMGATHSPSGLNISSELSVSNRDNFLSRVTDKSKIVTAAPSYRVKSLYFFSIVLFYFLGWRLLIKLNGETRKTSHGGNKQNAHTWLDILP